MSFKIPLTKFRYTAALTTIVLILQGCSSAPKIDEVEAPKGRWLWVNPELYSKQFSGEISEKEVDYKFTISKNQCKVESLQVPVPSPSCYVIPAPNCAGMTGFALGFCRSTPPREQCDYSSVNAAKDAQFEIFKACMQVDGWERKWVPEELEKKSEEQTDTAT